MSKVAITDHNFDSTDIEKEVLEPLGCEVVLRQCKTEEEAIDLTADADYVLTQFARVTARVIDAMENCQVIVRYGVGVDNVDLEAAAQRGIPVCNVPDYCTDEVADHTVGLILATTRRIVPIVDDVRAGSWTPLRPLERMQVLKVLTVGIVGFGRIGKEVAARLKPFKCLILVFDPVVDDAVIQQAGCTPVTFDELLSASDIISLHCPSNDQTRYMINEDSINKMKKGVMLINVARGDIVKTDDLIAGLESGQIGATALDVTDPEPINPDSSLLAMDNVIITSHVASVTLEAMEAVQRGAAEIVAMAVRGEKLPNIVNAVPG